MTESLCYEAEINTTWEIKKFFNKNLKYLNMNNVEANDLIIKTIFCLQMQTDVENVS